MNSSSTRISSSRALDLLCVVAAVCAGHAFAIEGAGPAAVYIGRDSFRHGLVELAPGDTVLLQSDGLPELFDEKRERLGYERATDLFREAAGEPPDRVVERLVREADAWAGAGPPDDDITFVVVRRRTGPA